MLEIQFVRTEKRRITQQVLAFHLSATIDEERTVGKTKKQLLLRQRIQELSAAGGSSDDVGVIGRQKTVPYGVGIGGGLEHFRDGGETACITRRSEGDNGCDASFRQLVEAYSTVAATAEYLSSVCFSV